MKRIICFGLCLCVSAGVYAAEPLRFLAVHFAAKASSPVAIDGKLDEKEWKKSPEFTSYRTLYGDNPQKTSLRILYDNKGTYFGIINSEKHTGKLKTTVFTRDGGQIWADDSGELYIDPTATGTTVYKFDINSVGAVGDIWQVDAGFTGDTWTASSAASASVIAPTFWTIEFFIAHVDLKVQPKPGDIWMFTHQRLTYTSGMRTSQSTNGGSFFNRRFGYIFFIEDKVPPSGEVLAKLNKLVSAPWLVEFNDELHYNDGKKQYSGNVDFMKKEFASRLEAEVAKLDEKNALVLRKEYDEASSKFNGVNLLLELDRIIEKALKLQQKNKLNSLFN